MNNKKKSWPTSLSAIYLAIRISTANLAPIMDCDEVFNYWEPLHFILFGTGMQTWEYAPQYALRTYAYLLPMAGIARIYQFLLNVLPASLFQHLPTLLMLPDTSHYASIMGSANKPLLFALLRSTLSIFAAYSELSFFTSIHDVISPNLAYFTAFVQLTSAGNFHANQAYLPSSSVMILWQLSISNTFRDRHAWAIFWGLLAVLAVGWPFCAVLFVTTGVWALWKAHSSSDDNKANTNSKYWDVFHVLVRTLLHATLVQSIVMAVDYHYYGQIVSPIWNIFSYNARGGGDELYGIEPLSYYMKNIALNFNVVALLGVVSLPILGVKMIFNQLRSADSFKILGLLPMYLWLMIVLPRPHKEERFLFPIYPMLSFGAAMTVDEILNVLSWMKSRMKLKERSDVGIKSQYRLVLGLVALSPAAIISISRSLALHNYYTAPLALYQELFHDISKTPQASLGGNTSYVCTGGEWYRFPSSFFLPKGSQLGFLKSSFGGQLPQPFTSYGSKIESLQAQSGRFNDMNQEEMDRYLSIEYCSYVVEMVPISLPDSKETPECLKYMAEDASGSWNRLSSFHYLDADLTPTVHRILYLPLRRGNKVHYKEYNLYSRSKSVGSV